MRRPSSPSSTWARTMTRWHGPVNMGYPTYSNVPPVGRMRQVFRKSWVSASMYIFVICFLLGDSPASEIYMPTFRNTLFHFHRQVGACRILHAPTCLWRWNRQSVPKRRHINFRRGESPKRKHTTFSTRRKFEIKMYLLLPASAMVFILLSISVQYLSPASSWTPILLRYLQAETLDPILNLIKAFHSLASYLPLIYSYL